MKVLGPLSLKRISVLMLVVNAGFPALALLGLLHSGTCVCTCVDPCTVYERRQGKHTRVHLLSCVPCVWTPALCEAMSALPHACSPPCFHMCDAFHMNAVAAGGVDGAAAAAAADAGGVPHARRLPNAHHVRGSSSPINPINPRQPPLPLAVVFHLHSMSCHATPTLYTGRRSVSMRTTISTGGLNKP